MKTDSKEKMGKTCSWILFLGYETRNTSNKRKADQPELQNKYFWILWDIISKGQRQHTDWERILVNHMASKGSPLKLFLAQSNLASGLWRQEDLEFTKLYMPGVVVTPIISVLWRLREEDCYKFRANLSYIVWNIFSKKSKLHKEQ